VIILKQLIIGFGMLVVSAGVNATCNQRNLAGTWAGGVIFSISSFDTCTVSVDGGGYLVGTCDSGSVTGRLTVNSACAVRGNVGQFSLTNAVLSNKTKRHIAGFGSNNGFRGSFAAAK
jgi:hypothetical protein